MKKISKSSYEKGCVLVRCPQCKSLHCKSNLPLHCSALLYPSFTFWLCAGSVIADHIGLFESPGWNIQKFLEENEGTERVKHVNSEEGVLELSMDDILPPKK